MIRLTFLILFLINNVNGQNIQTSLSDTLNQFNQNGKKQGYWIIYVGENLGVAKKENAHF
jgi:hypothetical protein